MVCIASSGRQMLRSTSQAAVATFIPAARVSTTPARNFASSSKRTLDHVPPRNTFPPTDVEIGPLGLNRLQEHYQNSLATDLMYMTYDHVSLEEAAADRDRKVAKYVREWDSNDPYAKNRPTRPLRGNRRPPPGQTRMVEHDPLRNLVRLEKVVITSFVKEAIVNKHVLVTLLAQLRAITGLPILGASINPPGLNELTSTKGHIKILRAKSGVAAFKLRKGMPVGVQAVLPGPIALQFLDTLVTFVLPRLRTFRGFALPPPSQPPMSPAALSGVVSLGMGPEAMPLFPQLEANWDSYPGKTYGFQVCAKQESTRCDTAIAEMLNGFVSRLTASPTKEAKKHLKKQGSF